MDVAVHTLPRVMATEMSQAQAKEARLETQQATGAFIISANPKALVQEMAVAVIYRPADYLLDPKLLNVGSVQAHACGATTEA